MESFDGFGNDEGTVEEVEYENRLNIERAILDRFGVVAKAEQVDAIKALVFEQQDVILVARTGFGKSIVFQATPLMFLPAKVALIIMPLKALEEEQGAKLQLISG